MMRKGEEARACSVSFSSKALTMGVLKRSSTAMIVLLLFFASLPGAKGVQQGNTQNRGGVTGALQKLGRKVQGLVRGKNFSPPESSACDIPDVPEDMKWGSGGLRGPTPEWVSTSIILGIEKWQEHLASVQGRDKERTARKDAGEICSEENAVNEIALKAYTKITTDGHGSLPGFLEPVQKMIKAGMDFSSGKRFCRLTDWYYRHLEGQCEKHLFFMDKIPMCKGYRNRFCSEICETGMLQKSEDSEPLDICYSVGSQSDEAFSNFRKEDVLKEMLSRKKKNKDDNSKIEELQSGKEWSTKHDEEAADKYSVFD